MSAVVPGSIRAPADLSPLIQMDCAKWEKTAETVKWISSRFSFHLMPNAPRNIDVFDVVKNRADETVLYTTLDNEEVQVRVEGFTEFVKQKIQVLQTFFTSYPNCAIQVTVIPLKENEPLETFSYSCKKS